MVIVRVATPADADAIADIYGPVVTDTAGAGRMATERTVITRGS